MASFNLLRTLCVRMMVLCLMAAQMQLPAALAAVLIEADGSHELHVGAAAEEVRLTLHHRPAGPGRHHAPHGHRGIVLLLAGAADEGVVDHVLHFGAPGNVTSTEAGPDHPLALPAAFCCARPAAEICFARHGEDAANRARQPLQRSPGGRYGSVSQPLLI